MEKETFHYTIPPAIEESIRIGSRVLIPLGKQKCEGFVIGIIDQSPFNSFKEIEKVIDNEPIISQEMVELALWVSEKYITPLHKVLEYVIPPYARLKRKKFVKIRNTGNVSEIEAALSLLDPLAQKLFTKLRLGPQEMVKLKSIWGEGIDLLIDDLEKRGLVEQFYDFQRNGKVKEVDYVQMASNDTPLVIEETIQKKLHRAPKQALIFRYVFTQGPQEISQLMKKLSCDRAAITGLVKKGLLKKVKNQEKRLPQVYSEFNNEKKLFFNSYQKKAIEKITQVINLNTNHNFLLHGVTGSGKTEVYLECIKEALSQNKGAILLVPEISLTPQVIGRFKSVLGQMVSVLHSNLSQGERLDVWESLYRGEARVIIGVRSAVFAPVPNLGLIIMDEEHETTYKQSEPDPRYHARDIAQKRCQLVNGVLVLGSATPALESYYKGEKGFYEILEMPFRVTPNPLPEVEVIDMREEFKLGNRSMFSEKLQETITETLLNEEQIILFLNRRGYATFVLCRECGTAVLCPNCSIPLTYHTNPFSMKCHYCNHSLPVPKRCSSCGSTFIRYFGTGTQQVEAEILKLWPDAKVTRMDVDTTQNKDSHQKLLAEFKRGNSNILIGTQMITKGLDFPNVTLVGVIAADTSLHLPDYTSSERTFQLLTQVAGRAGRGEKKGRVIIQTYSPDHYAVVEGKKQDYKNFYQKELEVRQLMEYPPFSSLIRIIISDFQENKAAVCSDIIARSIKEKFPQSVEILGPAQAPISKIKNRYRWQLILKGTDLDTLREAAIWGCQRAKEQTQNTLRIIIDVEPQSIL